MLGKRSKLLTNYDFPLRLLHTYTCTYHKYIYTFVHKRLNLPAQHMMGACTPRMFASKSANQSYITYIHTYIHAHGMQVWANMLACMHFCLPLCSPHENRNPAGELVVCNDTIVPRLKKVAIKQSFTYTHTHACSWSCEYKLVCFNHVIWGVWLPSNINNLRV